MLLKRMPTFFYLANRFDCCIELFGHFVVVVVFSSMIHAD
jgi:hypothetical protein